MADPTYPLFPIFAFLGFILALIPLPWHLQSWNSGTCFYMMWASLACLNQFVNSIVWAGNAINHAPIWCEISIRILMGASVGLPLASLCINRRLYRIANVHSASITRADKLRAVLLDTFICVVCPIVFIALQYVVQGHRFDIYEDIGCYPAIYNTIPAYFLSAMWPIVIGLISSVYCVLSLRAFARRRLEFGRFLSSNKSLTISRYFRLMALAMSDIVFTTPLAIYFVWINASATPVSPWISWEDTHFDYSRIEQTPAIIWHLNPLKVIGLEFSRWIAPACALIFFAFFGFADEARKQYRFAFWWLLKPFGLRPSTACKSAPTTLSTGYTKHSSPETASPTLPQYSPTTPQFIASSEKKTELSLIDSASHHDVTTPTTVWFHDRDSITSTACDTSDTTSSPTFVKSSSPV